ncbi:MAG TPA: GNAT family N-acetyltransferase [Puia sp.]|nr:GNAT family N-acetyltransferase [Puia sp.]
MIDTERLSIVPLTARQLDLYLQGEGKIEKLFGLRDTGRTVAPEVRDRVSRLILPALRRMNETDYLFSTFWIVIDRSISTIVAELGFKGRPGKTGTVEIGYGTMPDQRRKGYMTEAVGGMIDWARKRPDLHFILAETSSTNRASIRVLEKNQFLPTETRGDMRWWRIDVQFFNGTPV